MSSTATPTRQPVLYLSHGAPPLADDATWTSELSRWSARLSRAQLGAHRLRALGARPDRRLGHDG